MDFLQQLGIMAGPVIAIVGAVEMIKYFLKEKISALVDDDKKRLDKIWVIVVAVLGAGASACVVGASGWSWWQFPLTAISYIVGAVGTYVGGRIVFPWLKKDE